MNKKVLIFTIVTIFGCSESQYITNQISEDIYTHFKANDFENLDLSEFGGEDWTRVCFLGPYDEDSEKALGFDWQISEHTDVLKSDGHNVILFANQERVVNYVIHPRSRGDFWRLSGHCFSRDNSNFIMGSGGHLVNKTLR